MATEKSSAIILRLVPFSDTSLVVTIYTRELGKIGALAKGARRPKSSFESALDLLAVCRVVFIHKSSNALDILTEAKLERRFRSAARDLSRLYAGFYVAEILEGMTEYADPHPELYDATQQTLIALDETLEESDDIATWLTWYQLRLLEQTGQLPALDRCTRCGEEDVTGAGIRLGMVDGGLLCPNCRAGRPHVVQLRPEGLDLLRRLAAATESPSEIDPSRERGAAVVSAGIGAVVARYVAHVLGRPPRTWRFVQQRVYGKARR